MRYQTKRRIFAIWTKTGETVEVVKFLTWGHTEIKLPNGDIIPQPQNFLRMI